MLRVPAYAYVIVGRMLSAMHTIEVPPATPLGKINRKLPLEHLQFVKEECARVGLKVCERHADDVIRMFADPADTWEHVKEEFWQLYQNLVRELSSHLYLH